MSDSTNSRELIADIIGPYAWGAIYPENRLKAADAILAAMPEIVRAMVVPLVWLDADFEQDADYVDSTFICQIQEGNFWYGAEVSAHMCGTNEEAKAAANAHHVAQIMEGLGITV